MPKKPKESPVHPILGTALFITGLVTSRIRARDVIFYVDLIKNVFEASIHYPAFELQTVQILRLFKRYQDLGWGTVHQEGAAVSLIVSGTGLFQTLNALVQVEHILPLNESIFLQWLLDTYKEHLRLRIAPQLKIEDQKVLEKHLAPFSLFRAQLQRLEAGIGNLEGRIEDSRRLVSFVENAMKSGLEPDAIVDTLPSEYSYRLSHQKRFQRWLKELPEDLMPFELSEGIAIRQRSLYQRLLSSMRLARNFYHEEITAVESMKGS
jgi:hypothetical protein